MKDPPKYGTLEHALDMLAFCIEAGRADALNKPFLIDAIFDNLTKRLSSVRDAIAKESHG